MACVGIRDVIDKTKNEAEAIGSAVAMAGEFIEGTMSQGGSPDFTTWTPEQFDDFIECAIDGYITKLAELGETNKPPF